MASANSGSEFGGSESSSIQLISKIPHILPHERVFPIQIGSELFKLSGASISSDGASSSCSVPQTHSCSGPPPNSKDVIEGVDRGTQIANSHKPPRIFHSISSVSLQRR